MEVLVQLAALVGSILAAWFGAKAVLSYPFKALRRRIFGTMLLEHISALARLGLPVAKGIGTSAPRRSFGWRKDLERIEKGLEEGRLIGDALALVPGEDFMGYNPAHKLVSPAEAEVLRIAEMTGSLGHGIELVLLERRRFASLQNWAFGVFAYPAAVLLVVLSLLSGLMTFVVPKFAAMFRELDVALPTMTHYLISFADRFKQWWVFLVPLVVLAIILYKRRSVFMRSLIRGKGRLRDALQRAIYLVPFIHGGIRRAHLGEFCRELAMLLRVGTPAHRALAVIGEGTMNPWFRERVKRAAVLCEHGMGLDVALDKTGLDQRIGWFAQTMTSAPELADSLDVLGEDYMQEVSWPLIVAARIVPPTMVVVIGVLVGFVVVSLFMPLIQLMGSMG